MKKILLLVILALTAQTIKAQTVVIGTQTWTNKNLDVATYSDGTVIPQVTDDTEWANLTTGAWCYYNNDSANGTIYGKLYNWYAVAGIWNEASKTDATQRKKLAPAGYHVPSDSEWNTFVNFLGGETVAGDKMKETGTTYWNSPNGAATNSSKFAGLPGGCRDIGGATFSVIGYYGKWWSSSEDGAGDIGGAWLREVDYVTGTAYRYDLPKGDGFSVRCVKNIIDSLTTTYVTNITTTSANSGGEITSDVETTITARGVVWGTSSNPTIDLTTKTTDGSGTGTFTSSMTGLDENTTYYIRAYATNSLGTAYGTEVSFTTLAAPTEVAIGTQTWTTKNLDVVTYSDGTIIPQVTDPSEWGNLTTGAWCYYNNDPANGATYGKLYNWYAVAGIYNEASKTDASLLKKLAPVGYHVPSDDEWTNLTDYLGGEAVAGGKMKAITIWNFPNQDATNSSGFSGLPGGLHYFNGLFYTNIGVRSFWWSSSETNTTEAWNRYLGYLAGYATRNANYKTNGFSVRCIKNSTGSITNTPVTDITTTTAISVGTVTSDGGATITSRGVVWSTSSNPTIDLTTKTTDGSGTGTFTSTISGLVPNTTYYIRTYAINEVGTVYGDEETFTTLIPTEVEIGTQTWTTKNLNVATYSDGTIIPQVTDPTQWANLTTGAWCYYNNDSANGTIYGKLYNWYAVAGIWNEASKTDATQRKKLAPAGYHVPSDSEWNTFVNFLGGETVAGDKMKETNGFAGLPGGFCHDEGIFKGIGTFGNWWSSSDNNITYVWNWNLKYNYGLGYGYNYYKTSGFSVRCVKDEINLDAFITTWVTNVANETLTLPAQADAPNYTIDWGDGSATNTYTATQVPSHTYTNSGEHTVSFTGTFPHLKFGILNQSFGSPYDNTKLKAVQQWGTQKWTSMEYMFAGCVTLNSFPTQAPDLSLCTNMSRMFLYATSFNQPIGSWDVSNVTNMGAMFGRATVFNQPIGSWDVSKVTTMSSMFFQAVAFNQPLGTWDVSSVTDMYGMFSEAYAFNQPLDSWNVSQVNRMDGMFYAATSFNQPIGSWNVSKVFAMNYMFAGANSFNQPIGSWDVSNVNGMFCMFPNAEAFNQPLDSWNVSKVTTMNCMFTGASAFNQPIESWDVSSVTDMSDMFNGARSFNQDIGSWNVSKVTDMPRMFAEAVAFNQPIGYWNVSNVTDMGEMFFGTKLSTANYDATLIGWATRGTNGGTLQYGVGFWGGSSNYCNGLGARNYLTNTYGWTITDGGQDCTGLNTEVVIGTQTWTNKNLDVATYSDGTVIPQVQNAQEWASLTTGAWCYYNNDPANGETYGKLYNWYAVAGIHNEASKTDASQRKKLAPSGYHIPSDAEWTTLTNSLDGESIAGGKMKSTGTIQAGTGLWDDPNTGATNESGFTGLPGGLLNKFGGVFGGIGTSGIWWTSSPDAFGSIYATYCRITSQNGNIEKGPDSKENGFSVRYIKDSDNTLSNATFGANSFKIYPNPVKNTITLDFGNSSNEINNPYTVIDTLGKVILKGNLNEGNNSINVEQLSKGIYYLKVSDKNASKFIKE